MAHVCKDGTHGNFQWCSASPMTRSKMDLSPVLTAGGRYAGFTEAAAVWSKRLEILRLSPTAVRFGVLVNPANPLTEINGSKNGPSARAGDRSSKSRRVQVYGDFNPAFANVGSNHIDGLVGPTPDPLFMSRRAHIAALAARYLVPTAYWDRAFTETGGLISYGSRVTEYAPCWNICWPCLEGRKASDLPIVQATKFESVINSKAAKALGLEVPLQPLALADEVIE